MRLSSTFGINPQPKLRHTHESGKQMNAIRTRIIIIFTIYGHVRNDMEKLVFLAESNTM